MSADVIWIDYPRVATLGVGRSKKPRGDGQAHQMLTRGSDFWPRLATLVPRDALVHPGVWHARLAEKRQLVTSTHALPSDSASSGHG